MRRLVLFALLLVSSCGGCDASLVEYCPEGAACFPRPDGFSVGDDIPRTAHQGECWVGNVVCYGEAQECEGAVLPAEEQCDGLDNDCDGGVDEGLPVLGPFHENNDCSLCGMCTLAEKECVGGQWQCVPLINPGTEQCDGRDNDCDCEVDEDLPTEALYPEEEFPNTVGRGECRFGVRRCEDGIEFVSEPVTPQEELCNGLDDDCDGLVDEAEGPEEARAFLLAIDVSGSMSDTIVAVRDALCDFAVATSAGSQFAVVLFARGIAPAHVTLLQDFSDSAETCATLTAFLGGSASTGGEFALEAVVLGEGLQWPGLADQYALVFTDERLQYVNPVYAEADQARALEACSAVPFELGIYTEEAYRSDWTDLVSVCGGFTDRILSDRIAFAEILLRRFSGNCSP